MARRAPAVWLMAIVLACLLAVGAVADQSNPAKDPVRPEEDVYQLQKLLVETLDQVQRNYVRDVSRRELVEAAIRGILKELDPYSTYISPDDMKYFRTSVEGEFGGIGIQITMEDGQLTVLSPLVGTPAYEAGIISGDRIVEIDGEPTEGITLDEAVRRLKGQQGTKVTLTIVHPGRDGRKEITITREVIRINTVLGDHRRTDDRWDYMLDHAKRIGYVRITAFSRTTAAELRTALSELKKEKLRGLILDLRFNPGGLLGAAIDVSDLFVAEGRIVSTEGRNSPERAWQAHRRGTYEGFPMVVLVNRYSASASEIVAACLQDHKRAVIMGERTWGKGSVQNVIEMENSRSALKLTTASYRRPSGKNIHRFPDSDEDEEWGVMPNEGYRLQLTDRQLMALVNHRRQRDVLQPKEPEPSEQADSTTVAPDTAAEEAQPPDGDAPDETGQVEPSEEPSEEQPDAEPEQPEFVDLQLQMAVDFLNSELARAN